MKVYGILAKEDCEIYDYPRIYILDKIYHARDIVENVIKDLEEKEKRNTKHWSESVVTYSIKELELVED